MGRDPRGTPACDRRPRHGLERPAIGQVGRRQLQGILDLVTSPRPEHRIIACRQPDAGLRRGHVQLLARRHPHRQQDTAAPPSPSGSRLSTRWPSTTGSSSTRCTIRMPRPVRLSATRERKVKVLLEALLAISLVMMVVIFMLRRQLPEPDGAEARSVCQSLLPYSRCRGRCTGLSNDPMMRCLRAASHCQVQLASEIRIARGGAAAPCSAECAGLAP
jgi:hypothetical protein